ncbi:hypothetical protein M3Y98_00617800 [Aphelenchoides besseyi]|nr:hypothetical protein M3Y98_00617800 [Aphelenchoides besseyi]KAI6208348.1 hypothetical protein M3Y96_00105800 [Aphelenchoides besseyi]
MVILVDKVRSFLVRLRDQTNVTYSRFGRPGEQQDDLPLPTSIHVASFNENAPQFMFFRYWHVQNAAAACACFGMAIVILTFVSGFFEFNWYDHGKGVDFSALLLLFAFLTIGVLIHYYVLLAIKKQNAYYLVPFICIYVLVGTVVFFGILTLMFKWLDSHSEASHRSISFILLGMIIFITVLLMMLSAIIKLRQYLSMKTLHDMEMKVAEKSKSENPALQIVIATSNGHSNPNEQFSPNGENETTRTT